MLTQGQITIVDAADYEWLSKRNWYAKRQPRGGYYALSGRKGSWPEIDSMHRIIMDAPEGMEVDHRDRNKLNNVRENLRICTSSENHRNQPPRGGSSIYKGVSWNRRDKCWQVRIGVNGKQLSVGTFGDEVEAAISYNEAAMKYHGDFAWLNDVSSCAPTMREDD